MKKPEYEPFVPGTLRCCVCGDEVDETDHPGFNERHMMHEDCYENPDYYDEDDDYYNEDDD